MSVATYLAADPTCFGSSDVSLTGWEDIPNGIGSGESDHVVKPDWLVDPTPSVLVDQLPEGCGKELCDSYLFVHVDPASKLQFERDGTYVAITGHRQDPAANTCTAYPMYSPAPLPTTGDAKLECLNSFVLTSVRDADPPAGSLAFCPSSATLTIAAFQAADPACFHGKTLRILGYIGEIPGLDFDGPTIAPTWFEYPASVVWSLQPVVSEGNGQCPEGSDAVPGSCTFMFAMLDPHGGVPSPATHRWVILTGQIDDPVAETCSYSDGGPFGGPPPPAVYARQACRQAFVIKTVSYTTAPVPSP